MEVPLFFLIFQRVNQHYSLFVFAFSCHSPDISSHFPIFPFVPTQPLHFVYLFAGLHSQGNKAEDEMVKLVSSVK